MLLAGRAGQHGHQFPAVGAPLVQDLFGRMRQQRYGRVLPRGDIAHAHRAYWVPGRVPGAGPGVAEQVPDPGVWYTTAGQSGVCGHPPSPGYRLATVAEPTTMSESAHPDMKTGWPERAASARLHYVSGKGGTGKSTVAGALALALAAGGRRVL